MIMIKIYPSKLCGPISTEIAIQHGKLLEKVFSVKDTGIDSKIFHTWKMANILDISSETVEKIEKWVKDGIEWSARGEEILEMEG